MPQSKQTTTLNIVLTPYRVWDAKAQVEEWVHDNDDYYAHTIDNIELEKVQNEKWEAKALELPQVAEFVLEQAKPLAPCWEMIEDGTFEHVMDYARRNPGTGEKCRIRKGDSVYLTRKQDGTVGATPVSVDEWYYEEYKGQVSRHDSWEVVCHGTADELMNVFMQSGQGKFRIRGAV